jgi:hypothetical protein
VVDAGVATQTVLKKLLPTWNSLRRVPLVPLKGWLNAWTEKSEVVPVPAGNSSFESTLLTAFVESVRSVSSAKVIIFIFS